MCNLCVCVCNVCCTLQCVMSLSCSLVSNLKAANEQTPYALCCRQIETKWLHTCKHTQARTHTYTRTHTHTHILAYTHTRTTHAAVASHTHHRVVWIISWCPGRQHEVGPGSVARCAHHDKRLRVKQHLNKGVSDKQVACNTGFCCTMHPSRRTPENETAFQQRGQ